MAEWTLVLRRLAKDQGHDGDASARDALRVLVGKPGVAERQAHDGEAAHRLFLGDRRLSYVAVVTAWELDDALVTLDAHQHKVWEQHMPPTAS